jgi:hypothetical protein
MVSIALRLWRDLPNTPMPDPQQKEAQDALSALFRTEREVLSELDDLERSLAASADRKGVFLTLSRLRHQLVREGKRIHDLSQNLETATRMDPQWEKAREVVAEAAWKLLIEIDRFHQSVMTLQVDEGELENGRPRQWR